MTNFAIAKLKSQLRNIRYDVAEISITRYGTKLIEFKRKLKKKYIVVAEALVYNDTVVVDRDTRQKLEVK
jgi:hypothetical protein